MKQHTPFFIFVFCAFTGALFVYGALRAATNEWVWAKNEGGTIDKVFAAITAQQFLFFAISALFLLGIALYIRKKISRQTKIIHSVIGFFAVTCFLPALFIFHTVFFGILGPLNPGDFGSYRIPNNEEQAADVVDAFLQIRFALQLYYEDSRQWKNGVATLPGKYPEKLEDLVPILGNLDYKVFKEMPPVYEYLGPDDYHLGATIENKNSYYLTVDEDFDSKFFSGADTAGCRGEPGFACFDVRSKTREIRSSEHPQATK